MSKILKNTTASDIEISDTGITVDASPGTYTIPATDYLLWAASDNIITEMGTGDIVVNDGSFDLSISDGTDLIKGIFPTSIDVNTSQTNPLTVKPSNVDAFGRTRVSEVNTMFDYNFSKIVDLDLYWDVKLESGATAVHIPEHAHYELNVTNTIGSKATLKSRRHMEYHTGKSHIAYFTGNPHSIQAGMRKRLGLFTGEDGYFFELNSTGGHVVVRNDSTDIVIDQVDFNGDKLDGTGASGITVDSTKQQLFFIELQWLGSGFVRFGYILDGGQHVVLHTHYVGNVKEHPFTATAVLPFRIEVECVATALAADKVEVTCFSYMYEGKVHSPVKVRDWDSGLTTITVNGTQQAIFGIRVNPSYGESAIKMLESTINLVSGNSEVRWQLLHNVTFTGTPAWSTETNSIAQTLTSPGAVSYSGGYKTLSGFVNVGASTILNLSLSDVVLGHSIDGDMDCFLLVVETVSSNSKAVSDVHWEEFS